VDNCLHQLNIFIMWICEWYNRCLYVSFILSSSMASVFFFCLQPSLWKCYFFFFLSTSYFWKCTLVTTSSCHHERYKTDQILGRSCYLTYGPSSSNNNNLKNKSFHRLHSCWASMSHRVMREAFQSRKPKLIKSGEFEHYEEIAKPKETFLGSLA